MIQVTGNAAKVKASDGGQRSGAREHGQLEFATGCWNTFPAAADLVRVRHPR